MKLGLNLSFATKRWLDPRQLAKICRDELGVNKVQMTWDLIDPWWPEAQRDDIAVEYRDEFNKQGILITSTCCGLATCTYGHFLSPDKRQRRIALQYYKRGIDMTVKMGAKFLAASLGGFSAEDAIEEKRRELLYYEVLESLVELSTYAEEKGLEAIHIEQSPAPNELPNTLKSALLLMSDLRGRTKVPVLLLLDWGHILCEPLMKDEASMSLWLKECGSFVGSMHLQQTDGQYDRHWSFDQEGIVRKSDVEKILYQNGFTSMTQYLELLFPYEQSNEQVLESVKKTFHLLRT